MKNIFFSLVLILLVLTAGIGTAGYSYYTVQRERAKQQSGQQLSAVAELKVNEISRYRRERLADARVIIATPSIAQLVEKFFKSSAQPPGMHEIVEWMRALKDQYDYASVSLLETNGAIRFSVPAGQKADKSLLQGFSRAMRTMTPLLCEIEEYEEASGIHLDLMIPLAVSREHERIPVGALLIRIDPEKFIYPLIRSWPTPSGTAETMLIRREGDTVVFLNQLRHKEGGPLSTRLPLSEIRSPAVMAVQGRDGIVDGIDYRGSAVLAAIRRLPDTDWFLIAKVDDEEIYAPVRERLLLLGFLVALMIAGAGVTVGLIWSYQRSRLYLNQYRTEAEKLELAQRYERLTSYANDIILLVKEDGSIAEANLRAVTAYGRAADELIKLNMKDLEAAECTCAFEDLVRLAGQRDGFVCETLHRYRDGTVFPVEISMRTVRLMENDFSLMIIRDITERKQAEKNLKEAHNALEQRVLERTADLLALNERLKLEVDIRTRAQEELRALTGRLAETEESERRRLARELHDRVGQNLTALNFNISTVMNLLPAESHAETINRLEDSLKLVDDTVKCARDVMSDLRPPLLDDYGLAAVLRWYAREFSERSGTAAVVECEGYTVRPPLSVEIALFRIAQEALTNIMRHAWADRVLIELEATPAAVRMAITDNGVGMESGAGDQPLTQQSGWGMLSMRERAEMVGGHLLVESVPGGGTRISIDVRR